MATGHGQGHGHGHGHVRGHAAVDILLNAPFQHRLSVLADERKETAPQPNHQRTQLVPAGTSLVPAGPSWYKLVPAGTSWYQPVPAGTSDSRRRKIGFNKVRRQMA